VAYIYDCYNGYRGAYIYDCYNTYILAYIYRRPPLSESSLSISSHTWGKIIEELYVKIPHTSEDHILG
jgi:hypothetical protein